MHMNSQVRVLSRNVFFGGVGGGRGGREDVKGEVHPMWGSGAFPPRKMLCRKFCVSRCNAVIDFFGNYCSEGRRQEKKD